MLADNEIAPPFVSSPTSTRTEERLTVTVFYCCAASTIIFFVFMFLLLHRSMLICYVGDENLQILVICLATFSQYLIHSPDVNVQMLIASQSCFI